MPYRSSATSFDDTPWQYDSVNAILKTTYSAADRGIFMDFPNKDFRLIDASTVNSIDWVNRDMYDSAGIPCISYEKRGSYDKNGNQVFNWENTYETKTFIYGLFEKTLTIQNDFGDFTTNGFLYEGDVIQVDLYAGTPPSLFDVVSLRTDGTWEAADQTTASATKMLGVLVVDTQDGRGYVLLEGSLQVQSTTAGDAPYVNGVDHGLPIYLEDATTTGRMNTTVPTARYVRLLGYAYFQSPSNNIWLMRFDPDMSWVEI